MRESTNLNGTWRFLSDFYGDLDDSDCHQSSFDDSGWMDVDIPAEFGACQPELEFYEGAGWFRYALSVDPAWAGKHVVLRFEGVNQRARVWLNGELLGENLDGFLPFEFPVAALLIPGGENLLVVRADNTRHAEDVPGEERGWRTTGGILRDVSLVATDPLHLDRPSVIAGSDGRLKVMVNVNNRRAESSSPSLHVKIRARDGETVAELVRDDVSLEAGAETECCLEGRAQNVSAWSPEEPILYDLNMTLLEGSKTIDERSLRIGFRSIEAKEGKLLLNGGPIYLQGFNRHEESPEGGMVPDPDVTRGDLEHIKKLGCNFVRLCHYPHDPSTLALCDELGLLVMDEIPLYWWMGKWNEGDVYDKKLAAAKRQVETMVRRDINHPSVILWSVSNETAEKAPGVVEGNNELVQLAKSLDPSRLAVHVSNHWTEVKEFDHDDVMCLNGYPAWGNRGKSNQGDYTLDDARNFWESEMAKLHEAYPDKPILVAEFGHPALTGTRSGVQGEGTQSAALEAEFAGMHAPYVCGATIWLYADHRWPGGFEFMRFIAISPYGVVTRDRERKLSCDVVERMFKNRSG